MKIAINAFETCFLTPFSFLQAPTQTSHFWTRFKKFTVASLSQNALSQKFRWKISGSYVAINRMYSDFPEKESSTGLSMFLAITKFRKRPPGLQHIHLRSNFWTCGLWNVSRKDCCLPLNNRKRNTSFLTHLCLFFPMDRVNFFRSPLNAFGQPRTPNLLVSCVTVALLMLGFAMLRFIDGECC